jgi:type IV secretion system protein VirB9
MNNLFLILIMLCFLSSGCAGGQAKLDVNNDEPLIQLPADAAAHLQGQGQDDQSVDFEDISLSDKKRLHMLTDRAEIEKETNKFVKKGQADIITRPDGTFVFPYGLIEATLTTKKMFFSQIILEEGEKVTNAVAGDTTRWQVVPRYIGDADNYTPVILIKPFFGGLQTNLSIITNKRDYNIVICSVDSGDYMERMAFYYPQDRADGLNVGLPPGGNDTASSAPKINIENIRHDFVLKGDRRLSWFPKDVFEDGQKVYIKMPATVSRSELPVFMAMDATGQTEVVNYRYRRPYFVIDTLFTHGVLVLGTDKYRKVIEIFKQ